MLKIIPLFLIILSVSAFARFEKGNFDLNLFNPSNFDTFYSNPDQTPLPRFIHPPKIPLQTADKRAPLVLMLSETGIGGRVYSKKYIFHENNLIHSKREDLTFFTEQNKNKIWALPLKNLSDYDITVYFLPSKREIQSELYRLTDLTPESINARLRDLHPDKIICKESPSEKPCIPREHIKELEKHALKQIENYRPKFL